MIIIVISAIISKYKNSLERERYARYKIDRV